MFPGSIGYQELVVIAVVAVILFGGRLPEVARTIGQSYQQFRKGLADLQSTFNADVFEANDAPAHSNHSMTGLPDYSQVDDHDEPTGPRFEPPVDEE